MDDYRSTSETTGIGDCSILPTNGAPWNYGPLSGGSPSSAAAVHNVLPPRHLRKRLKLHRDELGPGDILVQGKTVYLYHLRPGKSVTEIASLLNQLGFTSFNINHRGDKHPSSIEFSHPTVATAAFSLLKHRASSLFIEPFCIATTGMQARSGVIDLTRPDLGDDTENDQHAATSLDDWDELYGDLGAYDDSDSDMDISDIETTVATSEDPRQSQSLAKTFQDPQSINLDRTTDLSIAVEPRPVNAFTNVRGTHNQLATVSKASLEVPILQSKSLGKRVAKPDSDSHNIRVVGLPVAAHNRGRRVLLPGNAELPIMTVSMRADFQFFHRKARHRISRYSIPGHAGHRHVGDAVMIGDLAVVGYRSSPCQISLICSREGRTPILTELKHKPHADYISAGNKTGGVLCLAAKAATETSVTFFTGGHDRTILLWSVTTLPDLAVNTERMTTLPIRPHALAYRDRTLLVGASRKITTLDLTHLSAKWPIAQLDNVVHHIHIHKDAPSLVILETDSLDSQIQIFDERKRKGFDRTPDCTFGARCANTTSTSTKSPLKSPCRGDTRLCLFAKGFADETVRLWDYRNCKRPVLTKVLQNLGAVTHTIFTEPEGNIICYNSDNLVFVDYPGNTD